MESEHLGVALGGRFRCAVRDTVTVLVDPHAERRLRTPKFTTNHLFPDSPRVPGVSIARSCSKHLDCSKGDHSNKVKFRNWPRFRNYAPETKTTGSETGLVGFRISVCFSNYFGRVRKTTGSETMGWEGGFPVSEPHVLVSRLDADREQSHPPKIQWFRASRTWTTLFQRDPHTVKDSSRMGGS